MRRALSVLGAMTMLALVLPVEAQQQAASFFTGVNPRNIQNKPVDVSRSMKTLNVNKAFHKQPAPRPFSLANMLPKFHMPTWPPVKPSTPVLDKKKNPFQPNPIVGKNPFDPPPKKKK